MRRRLHPLLLLSLGASVVSAQSVSLPPPWINSTASGNDLWQTDGVGTGALTALVILLASLLGALTLLVCFARQLAPVYGARVKYNVLTGQMVYRHAALRTLPTHDEAAQRRQAAPTDSYDGAVAAPPSAAPSRLGQVCPRGCDDSFWCPPCLLQCSCLDCLWCGPGVCCGANTCGEWLFTFVYRAPAARWWALIGQMAVLGLNVLALALDQWSVAEDYSLPGDVSGDTWSLRAGVLGLRAGRRTAWFNCPSAAEGETLLQCTTVRVAAGWTLALGILSSLLLFVSILYSLRLRCSLPDRAYTPGVAGLHLANVMVLTTLLLLWPLVPQLVLRDAYSSALNLGSSWGIFLASWFIGLLLAFYMRGQVESIAVGESGDPAAIAVAAKEQRLRDQAERRMRDPYGAAMDDASYDAAGNRVLIVHPEQLELAERRAEAARWTVEGYGGDGLSPLAAYASAGNRHGPPNPLGTLSTPMVVPLTGRPAMVQPSYRANDPIPPAQALQPTAEQLEQIRIDAALEAAQRHAQQYGRRAQRDRRVLAGPYSETAPQYIDAGELDRMASDAALYEDPEARWSVGVAGLRDLADNGLGAAQQAKLFGPRFGHGGAQLPRSLESFEHEQAHASPHMSYTYGDDYRRPPPQAEQWHSHSPSHRAAVATAAAAASPAGLAAPSAEPEWLHQHRPPMPALPDDSGFQHLDPAFVRSSLPISQAEMDALFGDERRPTAADHHRHAGDTRHYDAPAPLHSPIAPPPHAPRPPPQAPLTPQQYRAIDALERAAQPNLLTPAGASQSSRVRLPPLRSHASVSHLPAALERSGPLSFGGPGSHVVASSSPRYKSGAATHPHPHPHSPTRPYASHPFVLESPQRLQERTAHLPPFGASDRDLFGGGGGARVYSYTDPSQPPTQRSQLAASRAPYNLPSVSSRADLHFAGTFSQQQLQQQQQAHYHLGASQPMHWLAHDTQQMAAQQAPFALDRSQPLTPAPPARMRDLSIHVQGADEPLSRTIPTPMPIHYTYGQQEQHEDEEEREMRELGTSHSRRIPMAPQTPRVIEGPASAAVLRQTPRARTVASPYSREFGY